MTPVSRTAQIEGLITELIALYRAQAADLDEFAGALASGEGTVQLGRTLRQREIKRAGLYLQFEQTAFSDPPRQA
jgi:hypothetical protein